MPRTQTRFEGDQPFTDGHIFFSAFDAVLTAGAVSANQRTASGNYSVLLTTAAATMIFPLSSLLFRYGLQDTLQETFGSAQAQGANGLTVSGYTTLTTASASAGSAVNVAVINSGNFIVGRAVMAGTQKTLITAIPDATHITLQTLTATLASNSIITENLFTTPAGASGPPPFAAGASQPAYLTPLTSPRPKGMYIRAIYPVYTYATGNATVSTIGITKTVFTPGGAAPVITNVLANAQNGMVLTAGTTPQVTPIPIPTPAMLVTKYASYNIEWNITAPAASIYGVFLDVAFNVA